MPANLFQQGNPGRQKGSVNKTTKAQKEGILKALVLLDTTFEQDIAEMTAKERVDVWLQLQEFILPKLQRTQVEVEGQIEQLTKITFEVVGGNGKTNQSLPGVRSELPGHDENNSEPGIEPVG